ncbi:hypothetical protein ACTMTU_34710 [Streptomyces sp. OZ13]|uniref:hypothetical protein n=1 Tax=Streptomyces sp. OZ13 TaxID=3452210 RepID=UPI003F8BE665
MSTPPPFPPQQPYSPGPPQSPYGPQPGPYIPGPAPYPVMTGVWVPPQPVPRKKRTGLIAGIVAGSLVALAAVGYGVVQVVGPVKLPDGNWPKATHQLTAPGTVLEGTYALAEDASDTEGQLIRRGVNDHRVRDSGMTVASYLTKDGESALQLNGLYGKIKEPDSVRAEVLRAMEEPSEGDTFYLPPTDFNPAGHDVTVRCAVRDMAQNKPVTQVACAWADQNTTAVAVFTSTTLDRQKPEQVALAPYADLTAQLRDDVRQPLS